MCYSAQGHLIVIVPDSATQNCHTTRSHTSTTGREDDETNKNLRKVNPLPFYTYKTMRGKITGFVSSRDFDVCIALHTLALLFYPVNGEHDKGKDHRDLLALTPLITVAI